MGVEKIFLDLLHFHYIIWTYWPHPQGNEFHNAGKEISAYHNHVLQFLF